MSLDSVKNTKKLDHINEQFELLEQVEPVSILPQLLDLFESVKHCPPIIVYSKMSDDFR